MNGIKAFRDPFLRHVIATGSPLTFPQRDSCSDNVFQRLVGELEVPRKLGEPNGRRLNHFCLGSDPEFVFVNPGSNDKIPAASLGLLPGVACGCDQNQRLAELRGWPTTSAVTHVAGILSSLRWMYRLYPQVRLRRWRAGAYFDGDGLGGHIHFGRKRPNRQREVTALDGMANLFYHMPVFPQREWDQRRRPDAHNNDGYGKMGDIRQQAHGYEYRVLPSWLCSPTKAFIALTVAKLAVLDPELVISWTQLNADHCTNGGGMLFLRRIAEYFSARDDDALILAKLLRTVRNLAQLGGTAVDFKLNWGIELPLEVELPPTNIQPAVIKPHDTEVSEVYRYLETGESLSFRNVPATFRNVLPPRYHWFPDHCRDGLQWAGAGDLIHNLVFHESHQVSLRFVRQGPLRVGKAFIPLLGDAGKRFLNTAYRDNWMVDTERDKTITFSRGMMDVATIPNARKVLLSLGLPIWKVNDVEEESYTKFLKERKAARSQTTKPQVRKV